MRIQGKPGEAWQQVLIGHGPAGVLWQLVARAVIEVRPMDPGTEGEAVNSARQISGRRLEEVAPPLKRWEGVQTFL